MSLQAKIAAAAALLEHIQNEHSPATLASSLGAEDMVLTDLVARHAPGISIFTLDTGRLNPETYDLLAKVQALYNPKLKQPIQIYYPQSAAIEAYVNSNGVNAFYQSIELRKSCCGIRKVEPLKRALAGWKAWIAGLRRQQSDARANLAEQEWDEGHGLTKFNPLVEWSEQEIWEYIRAHDLPYNALHDKHYPSIGCAPCTRAIAIGEDTRAGRWWWEQEAAKECGLHVKKN
jgi:phosphoadenosine phosphosulfate reductase